MHLQQVGGCFKVPSREWLFYIPKMCQIVLEIIKYTIATLFDLYPPTYNGPKS
jgi:hypothetical protein